MALNENVICKSEIGANAVLRRGGAGITQAIIQNGLTRLYYGSEPIVRGNPINLKPRRRRIWRTLFSNNHNRRW